MRYERPIVMELSARASGQEPLGCYDGVIADSPNEICFAGGAPSFTEPPCWPGSSPGAAMPGDCIGGTAAFYCEAGVSGTLDPDGCRAGPSVV